MADAVGIVAGAGGVTVSRAVEAAPTRSTATKAASFEASLSSTSDAGVVIPALSQHVEVDPRYGLVTQFVDTEGRVVSQVPSSFALTYLRAGLASHGGSEGASGEVLA